MNTPEGDDLEFPRLYPPHPASICTPRAVDLAEDDNWLIADMVRSFGEMVERRRLEPERKFLDVRELCEVLALGHLKSTKGDDYEFVGVASVLVPVFFSTFGDGLHLNFFARPKGAPSHSPAHLMFVEVANGSPQKVIRCAPLPEIPYSHGDEDKRPSSTIIYHPDNEECPYCEHAKDGSLGRNFCLPPRLM